MALSNNTLAQNPLQVSGIVYVSASATTYIHATNGEKYQIVYPGNLKSGEIVNALLVPINDLDDEDGDDNDISTYKVIAFSKKKP